MKLRLTNVCTAGPRRAVHVRCISMAQRLPPPRLYVMTLQEAESNCAGKNETRPETGP